MSYRNILPTIALLFLLAACQPQTIEFPPTLAAQSTSEEASAAPIQDSAPTEETIPVATHAIAPTLVRWLLGNVVLDWQRPVINEVLAAYWTAIYHPPLRPDCVAGARLIDSPNPDFANTVLGWCEHWIAQNWFVRALPLHQHEARYFIIDEPAAGFRGIVVELDTLGPWHGEARYFADGSFYGVTDEPRTIWRLYLRPVGDELKIYAHRQGEYRCVASVPVDVENQSF